MKFLTRFVLCAAGLCLFAAPASQAADTPAQVDVSVEIYELPQAKAVAWQKTFENAADSERQKLVAALREKTTDGARTIGFGERVCALDKPSTVETIELYRYPTEFAVKDGFASPTAFEVNKVGCTMTLEITAPKSADSFTVDANIRDVALLTTQHYPASKADQPGSIVQPTFASQTVATRFQIVSGVPKLVSTYSPHAEDRASDTVRLILVTVRPDR